MLELTASIASASGGLMLPEAADSATTGPASGDGTGFASALAQAGAEATADASPSEAAGCLAPMPAQIEPLADDAAVDALQASAAALDSTSAADVQALEESFGSLADLAQQLAGPRVDGHDAARSSRPAPANAVDSAIAALVEALQFAPRDPADAGLVAADAPLGSAGDVDILMPDDKDTGDDDAELPTAGDPSLLGLPILTAQPAPPSAAPPTQPPVIDDGGVVFDTQQNPTLSRTRGENRGPRPSGGNATDRAAVRPAAAERDGGSDVNSLATQRTIEATAADAGTRSDAAPQIAEPRTASPAQAQHAHRTGDAMFQPLMAAATSAAAGPTAATAAAAPFHAQLSAAIDSPAFGSALGVQISTLADHGISEARLHLNPAELGPIAVQIGLDGTLAQVHMAVEHSSTRQALEQAMPDLAAALRDAGFTMTGGGVSQQSRNPQAPAGGAAPGHSRDSQSDEPLAALGAPSRATARRGMLDVYA